MALSSKLVHPVSVTSGTCNVTMMEKKMQNKPDEDDDHRRDASYVFLYLTLDVEEDCSDEDILFQFPKEANNSGVKRIVELRGVFLTVTDVMKRTEGSPASVTALFLDEELISVGCLQFGQEALIAALSATLVTLEQLEQILKQIERVLSFLYGSVVRAFSSSNHHDELHYLFSSLIFGRVSVPTQLFSSDLILSPALASTSQLQEEVCQYVCKIDSLEYGGPKLKVLDSAVYYKGNLVCSCLPANDCTSVSNYLNVHLLLYRASEDCLNHTVVWREVFLDWSEESTLKDSHRKGHQCYHHHHHHHRTSLDHKPLRRFMLVVGMKNSLLCVLLQSLHSVDKAVQPNALIVDMGRSLLLRLNAEGVFTSCLTNHQAVHPVKPAILDDNLAPQSTKSMQLDKCLHVEKDHLQKACLSQDKSNGSENNASFSRAAVYLNDYILHYVCLNNATGVIVSPMAAGESHSWDHAPLHMDLLSNFSKVCHQIRDTFHQGSSKMKQGVIEHGVLFEVQTELVDRKGNMVPMTGSYWIVGRHFVENDSEVFVALSDTVLNSDVLEYVFSLHL